MTDLETQSGSNVKPADEQDQPNSPPFQDSESLTGGSIADLDPCGIHSNLFNSQIAAPFLQQHLSKSILRFKRASDIKQSTSELIHKVPGPIRKALRIGKYRRVIEIRQNIEPFNCRKRDTNQQFSIKVRRLSPRMVDRLTQQPEGFETDDCQSPDNNTIQQREYHSSKVGLVETRYHSLNKKQRMHFTEYKNVFPGSPKKYRNSVETAIIREVNQQYKKHLVPLRKNSAADADKDLPKKFRGVHFLNIEAMKPAERRETTIKYLKNNCIMPEISEMAKIYGDRTSLPEGTDEMEVEDGTAAVSASTCGLSHPPLPVLASHYIQRVEASPKRSTVRQKPFSPPFERYYYRDLIWKVAFSHHVDVEIPLEYPKPFKVFIGPGNNKMLVKGLMKRRNWWAIVERSDDCHFAWTQIKIPDIFRGQKKCQSTYKPVECQPTEQKKPQKQPDYNQRVLHQKDNVLWRKYFQNYRNSQQKLTEQMLPRRKYLRKQNMVKVDPAKLRVHNHLENNYVIGNKKALFYTMSKYYQLTKQNVFDYLPTTFHIESGLDDPTYMKFLNSFYDRAKQAKRQEKEDTGGKKLRNVWIVKPGQFTNRGTGITVCLTLDEIKNLIKTKEKHANGNIKTYIVQTYLEKPFLYCRRKFDIRHYMMISSCNGIIRGYWYEEGYIRTTSFEYTLKSSTTGIHLTNDAIQKYLPEYGRYEKGNKLSYADFQKYLEKEYGKRFNFFNDAYPIMKKMATDAIKASFMAIDKEKREHNFEIFGMDFMIDEEFHPWLIEINTNPCLELSCPLLGRIIPAMVENALRIGLDPLFPPPANLIQKSTHFNDQALESNRFELVFDELVDGEALRRLYDTTHYQADKQLQHISDDDEVYQDEGKEWQENS